MNRAITEETLNAFIDQQLTPAEMGEVFEAAREDAELAQRICEIRQLKSLVKHAYDGIEPAKPAARRFGRTQGKQALAAALLLGLGGMGGWFMHGDGMQQASASRDSAFRNVGMQAETQSDHIILHLDSDKPERMEAVLDYADQILDHAKQEGVQAELEIVANSYGLNLLRAGHTPHLDRIDALSRKHANLSFVACGQTIARFQRDGQQVTLIQQAKVAPSAIGEVVSKLREGWTYIRV